MMRDGVLLSIRPRYARLLFEGTKTVELRRVPPAVSPGSLILIYESAPTMALVGAGIVASLEVGRPGSVWSRVRSGAGVSRAEYDEYFNGAERAAALHLRDVSRFPHVISLAEMRRRWAWFRPPQSYRYVQASIIDGDLRSLAVGTAGGGVVRDATATPRC